MQFLPPAGPLAEEALVAARETEGEGEPTQVFTAEHLAAIALQTGRAKDKARLLQFIEAGVLDANQFQPIYETEEQIFGGGGAEDGASGVTSGIGRALRRPPAPRLPRGVVVPRKTSHHQAMFTRIQTRLFRCLKSVDQTLGPFRALVGPNASGKTTFLDVIGFLGDLMRNRGEVGDTVRGRSRSFENLLWMGQGQSFQLAVEAVVPEAVRKMW